MMIRLIVGTKGSGKTKAMIDMTNESVRTTTGTGKPMSVLPMSSVAL